ncbi:YgdI/YgdR family lipoprotein [Roseateles violae]|uniref:YgdI/YgdR family lipoprotein n=1 Tax=Roseateles violae TaxID=3058042 RepID=A0ABT8DQN7_9BURK|nr:YgdI/YgdR family lipoprotein [Pelomonas sp. PFR6]MDN3919249.1 YgdI/YgdR family lipoprotein [Pelomonas sp. PFR6]
MTTKKVTTLLSALAATVLLVACGSTQYIISTKEGRMIAVDGKPDLDEKTGMYVYRDSEGRKATILKSDVVQIMER